MELPKIKNENLPDELKKILGDADAEFESLVDPMDVIDIPDVSFYEKERQEIGKKLIESRKKLHEYQSKLRQEKSQDV
ncbi:hypothetical protein [Synechococcus phage S-8S29]|nr:hypothetical protein [Synechococcus phage S-8S29]